jgi:hypothetical protein
MSFTDMLKDMASRAGEKAQDLSVLGKDMVVKAGVKAQDMGERGVLLVEIKQLEAQVQKLLNRLGAETYLALIEDGLDVSLDTPKIKDTLAEINAAKDRIEQKKADIQTRGNG